jgi:hypothetical protein
MRGYKAFEKGLICKGKQYAENAVFEEEKAEICNSGMHFCKYPLDVFDYYPLIDDKGSMSEFAEVEALDECKTDDNRKYCTKKLKIGAKLNIIDFIKASITATHEIIENEVKEETKELKNNKKDKAKLAGGDCAKLAGGYKATLAGGNCTTLAGGDSAKLAGGESAKLVGGNWATLAGGNFAKLAGGDSAKLVGGNWATLAGGDFAKLAGGNCTTLAGGNCTTLAGGDSAKLAGGDSAKLAGGYKAKLAGGDCAKLAGGDSAKLVGGNWATLAGGDFAKLAGGKHSVMIGDSGSIAKGKKGSLIVIVEREWEDSEYVIKDYAAKIVDGETIKEDTFYKLENGEFVEVR